MPDKEIEATSFNMFDWGMIVALHRDKLNQFMLQVYIKRYKSSESLPPVSSVLDAAGGEWRYKIESFLMDKPRMSFEATDMNGSRANMLMRVIGGNQINEKFMNGQWYAQSIEYFSPAQGPALRFDLKLADTPLIVGADDSVYMDLKDSDDFYLEFSESEQDQLIGGDFFKILFKKLAPEQRRYPIGNLAWQEELDSSLKPRSVILRTQKRSKASGDSEGAVLLFVQLGDELQGRLPTAEQLGYLLDGSGEAKILFNRNSVVLAMCKDTIAAPFRASIQALERDEKGRVRKVLMTSAEIPLSGDYLHYNTKFAGYEAIPQWGLEGPRLLGGQNLELTLDQNAFHLNGLKTRSDLELSVYEHRGGIEFMRLKGNPSGKAEGMLKERLPKTVPFNYDIDVHYPRGRRGNFEFKPIGAVLSEREEGPGSHSVDIDSEWEYEKYMEPYVAGVMKHILGEEAREETLAWVKRWGEIDLGIGSALAPFSSFVNLVFGEMIKVNESGFDGEMNGVIAGAISPKLTSFTPLPLEQTIGANGKIQFSVTPANSNVVWRLEDASRKNLGHITPAGLYTAPDASVIEGLFMQVRVIATDNTNGSHSYALVTVLKYPLTVNPLIDSTSTLPRKIKAGVAGDANQTLTWSIKKTGTEGRLDPTTGPTITYTPSKNFGADPDTIFVVDEITVSNGKESATSYIVNRKSDPVNVIAYTVNGNNTVECQATVNGKNLPAKWKVLVGPGEIDSDSGLYTADPTATQRFVLIYSRATLVTEFVTLNFDGYLILPLPLAEQDRALPGTVEVSSAGEILREIRPMN